jgi:putative endonuclease
MAYGRNDPSSLRGSAATKQSRLWLQPPSSGLLLKANAKRSSGSARNDGVGGPMEKLGHRKPPRMRQPAIYIMANRRNGALYAGVASNPPQRVFQHREGLTPGFTKRYGCNLLVYYETYDDMNTAIAREKQMKAGSRKRKLALIETLNPQWRDLYGDLA